jgi:hypothetical protein
MPCLMLVKAGDAPVLPSGGRWLDMEVVTVVDVGHVLGSGELTPQNGGGFYHVTVTDRVKDDPAILQYLEPVYDNTDPQNPVMLKRRNLYLDPANPVIVPMEDPQGTGAIAIDFITLVSATEVTVP